MSIKLSLESIFPELYAEEAQEASVVAPEGPAPSEKDETAEADPTDTGGSGQEAGTEEGREDAEETMDGPFTDGIGEESNTPPPDPDHEELASIQQATALPMHSCHPTLL